MAQAPRPTVAIADLSDDPIENVTAWLQTYAKPLVYGLTAVAIATAGIFLYRSNDASTRQKASRALYDAQAPLGEGKQADASAALEKVATRYASTSAGQQAVLLLAHMMYDEKKFDAGISQLQKAQGSVRSEFAASFEGALASGFEGQAKYPEAAEHFGKAAGLAKFPMEKGQFLSSQARTLMLANKLADATKIWLELAKDESLPFAQEAQVRLGEIAGAAK